MKHGLIILCLFLSPFFVVSQVNSYYLGTNQGGLGSDNVDFSVDTPTASFFENYIAYPDVNNSGKIHISLPLYEINGYDLKLGINLVYNTGGIRIDGRASNVGTGWNLMCGGAITRTVRDIPDDAYYFQTPVNICPATGLETVGWLHIPEIYPNCNIRNFPDVDGAYAGSSNNYSERYFEKQYAGTAINSLKGPDNSMVGDFEPDIFHFNVNGKSFDFVFTQEGTPKILGNEKYKIEYSIIDQPNVQTDPQQNANFCPHSEFESIDFKKYIENFTITDTEGYRYIFYDQDTERTTATHKRFYLEGVSDDPDDPFIVGENFFVLDETYPSYISAWHLSKIISPTGRQVNFDYETQTIKEKPRIPLYKGHCETGSCVTDTNRNKFQLLDFNPNIDRRTSYEVSEKSLLRVSIPGVVGIDFINSGTRLDSDGGKRLAEIQVKTGTNNLLYKYKLYHYYQDANICPSNVEDPRWCKRLFLDKVEKESAGSSEKINLYDFDYNSNTLPHRFSYEQDFWGYYNGNGAQSLIPRLYVYPTNSGFGRYRIYPIPGLAQNQFVLPGANRNVSPSKILAGMLQKITFATQGYREYVFEPNQYYDEYAYKTNYGGGLRLKQIKHNDGEGGEIVKNYSYTKVVNGNQRSSGQLYSAPLFAEGTNYFFRPGGNVMKSYFSTYRETAYYTPEGFNWPFDQLHNQYVQTEFDRWNKYTKRSSHPYNKITNEKGNTVLYTKITESISGMGRREYEFSNPEVYRGSFGTPVQQGVSMGNLYGNIYVHPPLSYVQSIFRDDGNFADNNSPFGSFKGNIQTGNAGIIPYPPNSHPPSSRSFNHGLIWKITDFTENSRKKVEKTFLYDGFRDDNELVYGLMYKAYETLHGNSFNQSEIAWAKYHHVVNAGAKVTKIITKTYDQDNPGYYVEKVEDYQYELLASGYRHLRKIRTSTGSGDLFETEYYYPHDLNGASIGGITLQEQSQIAAIESLKEFHRYLDSPVLTKTATIDPNTNEMLSNNKKLTNYYIKEGLDDFTMVLPKIIQESKGDKSFYELINFKLHNQYGNPIEVSEKGGPSTSYLWGYFDQYLVAKIEGKAYVSIPSDLGSAIRNTTSETSLFSLFEDLRNHEAMEDALLTTYTYKPLVGITGVIDAKGLKTTYHYDTFGRLLYIKDAEGKLVEEYTYHYKN